MNGSGDLIGLTVVGAARGRTELIGRLRDFAMPTMSLLGNVKRPTKSHLRDPNYPLREYKKTDKKPWKGIDLRESNANNEPLKKDKKPFKGFRNDNVKRPTKSHLRDLAMPTTSLLRNIKRPTKSHLRDSNGAS